MLVAISCGYLITGSIVVSTRLFSIEKQSLLSANATSDFYSAITEELLDSVGKQTILLSKICGSLSLQQINELITKTLEENTIIQSLYVVGENGRVITAASKEAGEKTAELTGNDMSYLPLYILSLDSENEIWSDKYVSPLTKTSLFRRSCRIWIK